MRAISERSFSSTEPQFDDLQFNGPRFNNPIGGTPSPARLNLGSAI
jgi:hypothetical protein